MKTRIFFLIMVVFFVSAAEPGIRSDAAGRRTVKAYGESSVTSENEPTMAPVEVTSSPVPMVTPSPVATASPTPIPTQTASAYTLLDPDASYKKGGQKGIRYHKIKGKKIYQLTSYTTDTITLSFSHKSTYRIYGGGSRKQVRGKWVTVSSTGRITCHKKNQDVYTIVQATSRVTGEVRYIYIYFKKKLSVKSGGKISLYEKKSQKLSFNYAKKKLSYSISNKKVATVRSDGKVTAKKKGTAYLTVKVKDSQKNQIRIRIVVKIEPWIVSAKDSCYDYDDMTRDLRKLAHKYSGKTSLSSLGQSYDKREIWCLRVGSAYASKRLIVDAAIHGREWKNTQIIMRQTEEILREYSEHSKRFRNVCIYVIPMDNPDGVTISQYGYSAIRNKKLQKKVKKIGHNDVWKANARGVDLNDNFPAGFKKKKGKKASYAAYPGKKAGSEKETKALMAAVKKIRPQSVINLHSTGNILYWNFNVDGALYQKLEAMATKIHSLNGYRLMPKSGSTDEEGGFADWLVYEQKIPSVTVETGSVACPLPHSQYKKIYKKNNDMLRWYFLKY